MKSLQKNTLALLLATTMSVGVVHAQSQAPLTRAQVKAEYDEAVRTGNILAPGDSGMRLNELYPNRYPRPVQIAGKTREEVIAELDAAVRSGDIILNGELGLRENERHPERYPSTATPGKTREQVRAEYEEAVRTGDIVAPGDRGLKLNEQYPQRYAKTGEGAVADHAMVGDAASSAASTAAR